MLSLLTYCVTYPSFLPIYLLPFAVQMLDITKKKPRINTYRVEISNESEMLYLDGLNNNEIGTAGLAFGIRKRSGVKIGLYRCFGKRHSFPIQDKISLRLLGSQFMDTDL